MNLKEKGVCACGNRGFCENGGELPPASRRIAQAARLLGAVGRIENDGAAKALHNTDSGHIVDKSIVAEERATFR